MLDDIYGEEHGIFRESFRKFVAREITPNVEQWERDRAVPRELWTKMGNERGSCVPGCPKNTADWVSGSSIP